MQPETHSSNSLIIVIYLVDKVRSKVTIRIPVLHAILTEEVAWHIKISIESSVGKLVGEGRLFKKAVARPHLANELHELPNTD